MSFMLFCDNTHGMEKENSLKKQYTFSVSVLLKEDID